MFCNQTSEWNIRRVEVVGEWMEMYKEKTNNIILLFSQCKIEPTHELERAEKIVCVSPLFCAMLLVCTLEIILLKSSKKKKKKISKKR